MPKNLIRIFFFLLKYFLPKQKCWKQNACPSGFFIRKLPGSHRYKRRPNFVSAPDYRITIRCSLNLRTPSFSKRTHMLPYKTACPMKFLTEQTAIRILQSPNFSKPYFSYSPISPLMISIFHIPAHTRIKLRNHQLWSMVHQQKECCKRCKPLFSRASFSRNVQISFSIYRSNTLSDGSKSFFFIFWAK